MDSPNESIFCQKVFFRVEKRGIWWNLWTANQGAFVPIGKRVGWFQDKNLAAGILYQMNHPNHPPLLIRRKLLSFSRHLLWGSTASLTKVKGRMGKVWGLGEGCKGLWTSRERKVWRLGRQKSLQQRWEKPKMRADIGVKFHQNLKQFRDFYSKVCRRWRRFFLQIVREWSLATRRNGWRMGWDAADNVLSNFWLLSPEDNHQW